MKPDPDIMTPDDALTPFPGEPTAEVLAWQEEQIRRALREADEGRFATAEEVRKVVQKYIPDG